MAPVNTDLLNKRFLSICKAKDTCFIISEKTARSVILYDYDLSQILEYRLTIIYIFFLVLKKNLVGNNVIDEYGAIKCRRCTLAIIPKKRECLFILSPDLFIPSLYMTFQLFQQHLCQIAGSDVSRVARIELFRKVYLNWGRIVFGVFFFFPI